MGDGPPSELEAPVAASARRAFTLAELVVAGLIAAIVVGAVGASLSQLARTRTVARVRLDSHLRTSMALDRVRREIQAAIRSDDLFDSRLLIIADTVRSPVGDIDRDELLVFNTKVKPVRERTYSGDGLEWETHFRVEEDDLGAALWMRTDAVPDDVDRGGGRAEPIMSGIIGLKFEAYDGAMWRDEWDSDIDGMPWAVRVTISGSGAPDGVDPFEDPRDLLSLLTVVPLDRVPPPFVPVDPSTQQPDGSGGGLAAGGGAGGGPGGDGADQAALGPPGGAGGAGGAGGGFTGGRGFGSGGAQQGGQVGGSGGAGGGAGVMGGVRGGGAGGRGGSGVRP
jgi:hypothetical protein